MTPADQEPIPYPPSSARGPRAGLGFTLAMLKIARGGYTLEPLEGGRVRVTLSTTYRMRSRLVWYAGLWGERMLGDVQDNVLAIIKTRAER